MIVFLQVTNISHENVRHALERDDFPDLRIACRMNVLHKTMQTISSPETPMIF